MTSKQLEAINVKIAKKMGWTKFRRERLPDPLSNEARMTGVAPGNFRHQFVPTFTSNLAYAMKCVDWAVEHGYKFQLYRSPDNSSTYYQATFLNKNVCLVEWGTIPSMAICMAFQKIK